jgi:hypothetical protein
METRFMDFNLKIILSIVQVLRQTSPSLATFDSEHAAAWNMFLAISGPVEAVILPLFLKKRIESKVGQSLE